MKSNRQHAYQANASLTRIGQWSLLLRFRKSQTSKTNLPYEGEKQGGARHHRDAHGVLPAYR